MLAHDARAPWLLLQDVPGIGPRNFQKLLNSFAKINDIICADAGQLCAAGLKPDQAESLISYRKSAQNLDRVVRQLEFIDHHDFSLISYDSEYYPALLREINSPPSVLYINGSPTLLQSPQIAMVGARQCSPTGRELTYTFAKELASQGLTITSGLAIGIDGISHQGALDAGGKTLAVLATGLDQCYPRRHQNLADRIVAQGGALVTEFPPFSELASHHFPRRNRIISGLSIALLLTEARYRSGSLITAKYALEQNREVFTIPGSIKNPLAEGPNELIKTGAALVTSAAEIAETLGFWSNSRAQLERAELKIPEVLIDLLNQIGFEPTPLDVLIGRTGWQAGLLAGALMELELKGLIYSGPGGFVNAGLNTCIQGG